MLFLCLAHFSTEIESKNPQENNEAPGVSLLTSVPLFPWFYMNRNLPPQSPLSDRGIRALEIYNAFLKKSSICKSKQMFDPELSCEEAQIHCNSANLISEELYFLS